MIISDIELTTLSKHLEKLKVLYQSTDENKHASDIKFLRDMICKIDEQLTNINRVTYNKIGNNKYIHEIKAAGHISYYYDKYHNVVSEEGLDNHIGEIFECHIVDMTTGKIEETQKMLLRVVYNSDGEITLVEFD